MAFLALIRSWVYKPPTGLDFVGDWELWGFLNYELGVRKDKYGIGLGMRAEMGNTLEKVFSVNLVDERINVFYQWHQLG